MKFSIEYLHMTSFSKYGFRENRDNANHTSRNGVNDILPYRYTLHPIFKEFGTESVYKTV